MDNLHIKHSFYCQLCNLCNISMIRPASFASLLSYIFTNVRGRSQLSKFSQAYKPYTRAGRGQIAMYTFLNKINFDRTFLLRNPFCEKIDYNYKLQERIGKLS